MQTMSASRVDTYINMWRNTAMGNYVKNEHGKDPETITNNFKILKSVRANLTV